MTIKEQKALRKNKTPHIKLEGDLDFFAETREQLQALKNAKKHSVRDVTTGRFKSGSRV
jgi:hypothetical protein